MLGSLGLLSIAAGAGAIMIPSNVALKSDPVFSIAVPANEPGAASAASPATLLVDPFHQVALAECAGCPYAEPGANGFVWKKNTKNNLVLDISVGSNTQSLELNGKTIYPQPDIGQEAIFIPQVKANVKLEDIESKPAKYLSHPLRLESFSALATTVHAGNSGEEVIKLELDISKIQGQTVNVPNVIITAIKNSNGQLMLTKIDTADKTSNDEKCSSLMCRWRGMIARVMQNLDGKMGRKGCHKHGSIMSHHAHKGHGKQHHDHKEEVAVPHHKQGHHGYRPHHHPDHHEHHEHHHGHHHHGKMHRFFHKLTRVMLTIVVPILVGILAGMLTYVLGMFLGTAVALLWIRFRTSRAQYTPVSLDDSYEEEEFRGSLEKGEYMDEESFESPPIYVEVEATEVGQK